jgi:L-ascorbate metabolism protein UlaG (beta-lactamase superfamily)
MVRVPSERSQSMLERYTWFRQSAFLWSAEGGPTVYVDPWGVAASDPPADLVLITHAHDDHFRPDDLERVVGPATKLVAPHDVARELSGDVTPVRPGESHEVAGVRFSTVPAYNVAEERLDMHPRSNDWVGFLLELGGGVHYHAGDTDRVPELESIRADAAFLPIGGTYTMDVEEAAGLAKAMSPGVAVPTHFGFRLDDGELVGASGDAERFRDAAAPVPVEVLTPRASFED